MQEEKGCVLCTRGAMEGILLKELSVWWTRQQWLAMVVWNCDGVGRNGKGVVMGET